MSKISLFDLDINHFKNNLLNDQINYIFVLSAALNPIHNMHIQAMNEAKKYYEEKKLNVVAGYLAPSSDSYVKSKDDKCAISLVHRNKLCDIAISANADNKWIKTCPWGWVSGPKICRYMYAMLADIYPKHKFQILEVGGADYVLRARKWRNPNGFICIARPGYTEDVKKGIALDRDNPSFVLLDNKNLVDISSTKIRSLLYGIDNEKKKDVVTNGWVLNMVFEYIINNYENELFVV
jgi:nicotinic acid mononucleotide adenylyltransferase